MKHNNSTHSLVKKSIVEARIKKWFRKRRKKDKPPSKLLSILLKPKKGIHIELAREERKYFVSLIRRIYTMKKIVSTHRSRYGRKPKEFYTKVFGFPPRDYQRLNVVWNGFNIHFVFDKNDLIAFQRKINWGPGVGGYYPVGDRNIKIKDLRGLVSFGIREDLSIETWDVMRHESIHAFESIIKRRKQPNEKRLIMNYVIKSEMTAYLHNFKRFTKKKRREINRHARQGLGLIVRESIEDYLGIGETKKRIENLKLRLRKYKTKRRKKELKKKLKSLKKRLEKKKETKTAHFTIYRKNTNQIKKALDAIPLDVLHNVIFHSRYDTLYKKIPETVKIYRKMKNQYYYYN
jgi:hypothetical protein